MIADPSLTAKIAELVTAATSHMITSFVLLNHHFALFTLFKLETILQKFNSVLVTRTEMFGKETTDTVLSTANDANNRFFIDNDITLTTFIGAESEIRITVHLMIDKYFVIALFLLNR